MVSLQVSKEQYHIILTNLYQTDRVACKIVQPSNEQLEESTTKGDEDTVEVTPDRELLSSQQRDEEEPASDSPNITDLEETSTRIELQELARPLEPYLEDGKEEILNNIHGISRSHLPSETMIEIQNWIQSPMSKVIWVEGDVSGTHGSNLSLAAMQIYAINLNVGIPCVSSFCKSRYNPAFTTGISHKEAGLVALLYSIIAQLVQLLPIEFAPVKGLDEANFQLLNGTLGSARAALGIIEKLLANGPPAIIWALDGFQLIEERTTIPYLVQLVSILRREGENRLSKACFTTDVSCLVLSGTMSAFERVDASRTSQDRPGQLLKGVTTIDELQGP